MKLAIFDLDDTLIDFASTRRTAYAAMATALDREGVDAQAYLQACPAVDRALFALFEQGRLSRAGYRARRFAEPFAALGLAPRDALVRELNTLFMDCVNDRPLLHDDALPVLQRLRAQGLHTAILTNGPADGQRRKLRATGLADAVDHVAISEELGVSKPSAAAFHAVVARFAVEPGAALMIGDSPELDYDGAIGAGLQAVLLDRENRHRGSGRTCVAGLAAVLPD
jgi:putative hydrolase of the HAD superfamily